MSPEESIRANEREKIALELEAWNAFWSRPIRVSSSKQVYYPGSSMDRFWLLEFAKMLRKDEFKAPTGPRVRRKSHE